MLFRGFLLKICRFFCFSEDRMWSSADETDSDDDSVKSVKVGAAAIEDKVNR